MLVFALCCTVVLLAYPLFKSAFEKTARFILTLKDDYQRSDYNVDDNIKAYNKLHDDSESSADKRGSSYSKMVNTYYELATTFYEWGWGTSFHFAEQLKDENFWQSIKRHEYQLASRLNLKWGEKVLDCGCGIGGPMRNIARFTGCNVTGITISGFQVRRGNELTKAMNLENQCKSIEGDFMKLPFEDNSFDGVYAIEATCHAPNRVGVYSEIFRVLKPGQYFACYEWCMTKNFDPENAEHQQIKKDIEEGDGLPDIASIKDVTVAIRKSGFRVIETRDCVNDPNPGGHLWYHPISPTWYPLDQRFQFNPVGSALMDISLGFFEKIGLVPEGTAKVQTMLMKGQSGLLRGGRLKIFTPMWLMVCQKPAQ